MARTHLLQAKDSVTGDIYVWASTTLDDSDYDGPNEATELALLGSNGSDNALLISTDESHEITLSDYGSISSTVAILTVFVADAATITLPDDASRQLGTTIRVVKVDGYFAVTVDGNGAQVQTGPAGQSHTEFPLSPTGTDYRGSVAEVTYQWDGTQWVAIGVPGIVGSRHLLTESRNARQADANQLLHCDEAGAIVYTVDADTFGDGDRVDFLMTGSGSLTIAAGTGSITITPQDGGTLVLDGAPSVASLICYGSRGDTPQLHVLVGKLVAA